MYGARGVSYGTGNSASLLLEGRERARGEGQKSEKGGKSETLEDGGI